MNYLVRVTYDTHVQADSPEDAVEQVEADLENEPLYGPFTYEAQETSDLL